MGLDGEQVGTFKRFDTFSQNAKVIDSRQNRHPPGIQRVIVIIGQTLRIHRPEFVLEPSREFLESIDDRLGGVDGPARFAGLARGEREFEDAPEMRPPGQLAFELVDDLGPALAFERLGREALPVRHAA